MAQPFMREELSKWVGVYRLILKNFVEGSCPADVHVFFLVPLRLSRLKTAPEGYAPRQFICHLSFQAFFASAEQIAF